MQSYYIAIVSAFVLTALISGNFLSVSVGTVVAARITKWSTGVLIGIAGYIGGLVLEGKEMRYAATALLPHSYYFVSIVFLISIIAFLLAYFIGAPLSLTMVVVGSAIGISAHLGRAIDENFLIMLALIWIASPTISILVAFFSNKLLTKRTPKDVWKSVILMRWLLILTVFFASFIYGANSMGLILNFFGGGPTVLSVMLIAIVVGSLLLSRGSIKRISEEMYTMRYSTATVSLMSSTVLVGIATLLGIPLSDNQTLSSSIMGSGLSYVFKMINARPYLLTVVTWIISTTLSFSLGYLL